jgi:uncharacterized membrane protein YsdA (DUF1294 family)
MRPETFHFIIALVLTVLIGVGFLVVFSLSLTWYSLIAAWFVAINLTTFGYYAHDKAQASSSGQRVPELVLHGLVILGGTLGAYLAMRLFRHKTIKSSFRLVFGCIVLLQLALAAVIVYRLVWR